MGITLAQNRVDLIDPILSLEDRGLRATDVTWTPRIGIRVGMHRARRAIDSGSRAVSGR